MAATEERRRTLSQAQKERWARVRRERQKQNLPPDTLPPPELPPHRMVDEGPTGGKYGWTARCVCGWYSSGHISELAAKLSLFRHQEEPEKP